MQITRYFLFIYLFCLAGCGFHLRDNIVLAPPLQNVYLKTADPYGQLTKNLTSYLNMSGIHLANQPSEATSVLDIMDEQQSDQLLSTSGTQQTRQYNLILTVTFQVTDPKGKVLAGPQVVSESRSLTIQANQILAGSNESLNLYQLMRRAIVFDMMNRLSSQDVATMLQMEQAKK